MANFWIKHGWYKVVKGVDKKLTKADWRMGEGIRQDAVRFLVEKVLRKDPRDIIEKDFHSNRLRGLLHHYYNWSPYAALREAGYDFHPWELRCAPMRFYESKDNRKAAIRWLVDKLKKDPRDTTREDFESNRLGGLLTDYYRGSPYDAFKEAGYSFYPWELLQTPHGFYESKDNRIAAICWLVVELKKDARDITKEDFHSNRLGGLLYNYYNNSPYDALKEAGYELQPWEMLKTPNEFYKQKSNRIAAIRWLVDKLKKEPRGMTREDFFSNCLGGLLYNYYNTSPYAALREAGLVTSSDEIHMCKSGPK